MTCIAESATLRAVRGGFGARGFTMIELIVVVMITGIMAIYVAPRFDLLSGYDEAGFKDKAVAAIQYARKAAIAQRREVIITVADSNLSFAIQPNPPEMPGDNPVTLAIPVQDGGCLPAVVCHPSGATLGPDAVIRFDPQGRTLAGAGTYKVSGTAQFTFVVEAETGYVH